VVKRGTSVTTGTHPANGSAPAGRENLAPPPGRIRGGHGTGGCARPSLHHRLISFSPPGCLWTTQPLTHHVIGSLRRTSEAAAYGTSGGRCLSGEQRRRRTGQVEAGAIRASRGGGARDKWRQVPFGREGLCLPSPASRQSDARGNQRFFVPQNDRYGVAVRWHKRASTGGYSPRRLASGSPLLNAVTPRSVPAETRRKA